MNISNPSVTRLLVLDRIMITISQFGVASEGPLIYEKIYCGVRTH